MFDVTAASTETRSQFHEHTTHTLRIVQPYARTDSWKGSPSFQSSVF